MALPTGPTCFTRPARTRVRRYSAKDVSRIYCKAVSQGVAEAEIDALLKASCKTKIEKPDDNCSCEELIDELADALDILDLAIEIGGAINPTKKAIKKVREWLRRLKNRKDLPEIKDLEKEFPSDKEMKELEDAWARVEPILKAKRERVDAKMLEVLERIDAQVVIKP
jgi:hypothetical protein